jgi:hypothetical protein
MIIGNSLAGALGGGSSSGYTTPAGKSTSGNAAPSSPNHANSHGPSATEGENTESAIRDINVRQAYSGNEPGSAIDLHQTARIMTLVASMRQVDDISAYSLFGRNEGETDQYRHVVSAYKDATE